MLKTIKEWAGVVALVAILLTSVLPSLKYQTFGAIDQGNISFYNAVGSLYGYVIGQYGSYTEIIDSSGTYLGNIDTNTSTSTFDGNIVVTTSNTATSSIQVGCVQTVATSTATPIRLSYSTANNATTTFSGTAFGLVAWQFGKCPRI